MIDEHPRLQAEAQLIADQIIKALDSRWPDRQQHYDHHRWIEDQIQRQGTITQRRYRIIDYVVGGALLGSLLGTVGWLGSLILERIGMGGPP